MEKKDDTEDRKVILLKRMSKCARKMSETAKAMLEYAANIRDLGEAVEIEAHAKQLKASAGIVRSWMKFMFPKKKEA